MNKRAFQIYTNVINAMQDADEIEGVEGNEYLELMIAIRDVAMHRFNNCIETMALNKEAMDNSQ